jgi:hypothetical protein
MQHDVTIAAAPVVRTLVHAGMREWLEARVLQTKRRYQLVRSVLTRDAVETRFTCEHADTLEQLYGDYPFRSNTCLVVHWTSFNALRGSANSLSLVRDLRSLVAGWDSTLLLVANGIPNDAYIVLNRSEAHRLGVAHDAMSNIEHVEFELARLWSINSRIPGARSRLPAAIGDRLTGLPMSWRAVMAHAIRTPDLWTVKLLANACSVDRSTLERTFLRNGLPTPAQFLLLVSNFDGGRKIP